MDLCRKQGQVFRAVVCRCEQTPGKSKCKGKSMLEEQPAEWLEHVSCTLVQFRAGLHSCCLLRFWSTLSHGY